MYVFINAISISEGGGLVVLKKILQKMIATQPDLKLIVSINFKVESLLPKSDQIQYLIHRRLNNSALHQLFWYEIMLPKLIQKYNIALFISFTNFLPRRKLQCPSLLLVQHAGYFSNKFEQLYLERYNHRKTRILWKQKKNWVIKSIKAATKVTVQTNALAEKIIEQLNILSNKITVIPHGCGIFDSIHLGTKNFPKNQIIRLGYITKFGVQKDFSTLFKAVAKLKKSDINIKLILTLDETTNEFESIKQEIELYKIEDVIENHGEVSDQDILKDLYHSLHLFIFPSLCESFGFTLVEAMASGLPIIIADTVSNCEIAGNAGLRYKSENENQLVEKVLEICSDPNLYTQLSQKSIERAQKFSWNKTTNNMIAVMNHMMNIN